MLLLIHKKIKNKNSKVKDEVITDVNDNTECDTNEEKDNKDIIVTKGIGNNDEMNIRSTVSKDVSNHTEEN